MTQSIENIAGWLPIGYRRYCANRGGHAPGHLRDGLVQAIENAFDGDKPWWDLLDIEFFDSSTQRWWDEASGWQRGEWLLGQLWNCTDIASAYAFPDADLPHGRTYARLARMLKAEMTISEGQ